MTATTKKQSAVKRASWNALESHYKQVSKLNSITTVQRAS